MPAQAPSPSLQCSDYKIGWICALPVEYAAAAAVLDAIHNPPSDLAWQPKCDHNQYTFGQVGGRNIVLAVLPAGIYGIAQAALATSMMAKAFPSLYFVLMVGVGGGVPSETHDIRLGDVVVSRPGAGQAGVLQYDFGKIGIDGEVTPTGVLNKPPPEALTAIAAMEMRYMMEDGSLTDIVDTVLSKRPKMRTKFAHPGVNTDILYRAEYNHVRGNDCRSCAEKMIEIRDPRETTEPVIHYGLIGSANQVVKDGMTRERLRKKHNILCFEMEAAGMMDSFPCLVIRGICDYADSHKNKAWQGYASMTAAAYAKDLLLSMGAAEPRPSPQKQPVRRPQRPQRSVDPRTREDYGKKLLQAAENDNMAVVRIFLEKGGDPNTADKRWGVTALHYTAQSGHNGTTRLLLLAGANPNVQAKFSKNTPLFEAASHGYEKIVQQLLEYGADITGSGKRGRTALHEAAANGHLACAITLVKNGADRFSIDSDGCMPLDLAEKAEHEKVIQFLKKEA
ncbi:nucleoside phosphorylase domain-containing protein [Aspergillus avenaceus]|uniref:Nucleoside phosphorylase domain-containing protein n=1 Tax=Aspergillus avenaceus TaxID=36643 RepID=A0A5N6TZF2_ASPAV|nr:nucleoside phosphorylase domain-containing protein [Aspergillus avenaceus]